MVRLFPLCLHHPYSDTVSVLLFWSSHFLHTAWYWVVLSSFLVIWCTFKCMLLHTLITILLIQLFDCFKMCLKGAFVNVLFLFLVPVHLLNSDVTGQVPMFWCMFSSVTADSRVERFNLFMCWDQNEFAVHVFLHFLGFLGLVSNLMRWSFLSQYWSVCHSLMVAKGSQEESFSNILCLAKVVTVIAHTGFLSSAFVILFSLCWCWQ